MHLMPNTTRPAKSAAGGAPKPTQSASFAAPWAAGPVGVLSWGPKVHSAYVGGAEAEWQLHAATGLQEEPTVACMHACT